MKEKPLENLKYIKKFNQLKENLIIDWEYIIYEYENYKRIMSNHANMNFAHWLNKYYIISNDDFNKINNYDYFKIHVPLKIWLKNNFDIPKDKGHHHNRQ